MSKEGLRRQPVWIGVLFLGGIYAALLLADGDTATSWGGYDMVFLLGAQELLLMCIPAGLFGLWQFWLLRKKGERLAAWLPLILSGVLFGLGELSWTGSGLGDRLMGGLLWYIAFSGYIGVALAVVLDIALRQKRKVKIAAGAVAVALLLVAVWFWPRDLGGKVALDPGGEYVWCFKGNPPESKTVKRDRDELLFSFRYLKVIPAYSGPEELFYGCKLFRLNGEYIILAKDSGSSYIYRWSGPLEDFDGSGLAWRTSSRTGIYDAIY